MQICTWFCCALFCCGYIILLVDHTISLINILQGCIISFVQSFEWPSTNEGTLKDVGKSGSKSQQNANCMHNYWDVVLNESALLASCERILWSPVDCHHIGQQCGALMFLLLLAEQPIEQTIDLPVILVAIVPIWWHCNKLFCNQAIFVISMAYCKTTVTPLLTHWSYYSLALVSHWYEIIKHRSVISFFVLFVPMLLYAHTRDTL